MIKTRFAPSPTGFLHVGGLRTALFAYLFARKNNGKFLLRIEDTDRGRLVEGGVENILNSLLWAGIKPDEGVSFDEDKNIVQIGSLGKYVQSERLEIYHKYVDELLEKGSVYKCFCSTERLAELRKTQQENRLPTGYDGCCKKLSEEDVNSKVEAGQKFVVRMKMPDAGITKFTDLVRGEIEFKNELIDDQVVLKSDGFPTYHLAVVVDDHLMEITHIFRGEEWLSSTPKHIVLYEMFGWKVPQFAHLSLLVNEKKQKLSKRHGDVSVTDFKEVGYLPEALVNFVSFLGWNPGDEREIFSLLELEQEFSVEKISKAAAVFNREKLDWYNSQYIKNLSNEELLENADPFLVNANLKSSDLEFLLKAVSLEKDRVSTLKEIPEAVAFLFAETLDYDAGLLTWKKSTKEDAKEKLQEVVKFFETLESEYWTTETLEEKTKAWIGEKGYGVGDVLWPVRVALSGKKNSPSPFEIANVLGKEKTVQRISEAINKI
ncbi:MAG: glutamate--tRNA ligase [Candidatus Magasanikbacteria bacterium]|nr:glutamate--tRNA ligase [Candidatus Magasanikbacteria bacterium]